MRVGARGAMRERRGGREGGEHRVHAEFAIDLAPAPFFFHGDDGVGMERRSFTSSVVRAPEPSVFGSCTSAPSVSSAATSAARPCRAASISGVSPSRIAALRTWCCAWARSRTSRPG